MLKRIIIMLACAAALCSCVPASGGGGWSGGGGGGGLGGGQAGDVLNNAYNQYKNYQQLFVGLTNNFPRSRQTLINMSNMAAQNARFARSIAGNPNRDNLRRYINQLNHSVNFTGMQINATPDGGATGQMSNFQFYTTQVIQRLRTLYQ